MCVCVVVVVVVVVVAESVKIIIKTLSENAPIP